MESKKDKFVRLAENRTNNALKNIQLLENLANKNSYDYEKEDLDKIVKTLKQAVSDLERTYAASEKKGSFKLR